MLKKIQLKTLNIPRICFIILHNNSSGGVGVSKFSFCLTINNNVVNFIYDLATRINALLYKRNISLCAAYDPNNKYICNGA